MFLKVNERVPRIVPCETPKKECRIRAGGISNYNMERPFELMEKDQKIGGLGQTQVLGPDET